MKIFTATSLALSLFAACAGNPFGDAAGDGGSTGVSDSGVFLRDSGLRFDSGTTTQDSGQVIPDSAVAQDAAVVTGDLDCGGYAGLQNDFASPAAPSGFNFYNGAEIANGQLEFNFPATTPGNFQVLSQGMGQTTFLPVTTGRLVARLSQIPAGNGAQSQMGFLYQGAGNKIVQVGSDGNGGQFLKVGADGAEDRMGFGYAPWISLHITPTGASAEQSTDGESWTVVATLPFDTSGNAQIHIATVQFQSSTVPLLSWVDDLNVNCL